MVTEEQENPVEIEPADQGKYVLTFDPLDGSSNIDANVSIGSIFGIWKRKTEVGAKATPDDYLRNGNDMLAGGYCLYGSSVHFLFACKGGSVNGFTLDPSIGEFLLTHPNITIPKKGKYYSINEGNSLFYYDAINEYVKAKKFPAD